MSNINQMIYTIPALEPIDQRVLREIGELREQLRLYLRVPQRWNGTLRRTIRARAVRGSTAIEGYESTLENVTALLEGEEEVDAPEETRNALAGYRDAMTFVLQVAADWPPIDASVLRALHYIMLKYDFRAHPGNWRPGGNWVRDSEGRVVYTPPPRDRLEGLIEETMGQLAQEGVPVLARAAMAHLNLVMIHPFRDGNGRMARCLQTFVLAAGGIPEPVFSSIEEYLGRNTDSYYRVLQEVGGGEWSPERDARPWLRFCLTAHYRSARTQLRRIEETEFMWGECEILAEREGLPERVVGALNDAARGRVLRRSSYQRITELSTAEPPSEAVATRDLAALVRAGLLLQEGEARNRRYRAASRLTEVWARTRSLRQARLYENPYRLFGQSPLPDLD